MPQPYRWLDRRIAAPGPYLTLCLSEVEFHHALFKLKAHERPEWISQGANATTHHLHNADGHVTCIVCLREDGKHTGVQVAAMLVHEAVHVWQEYCDGIGEKQPGREQEAYGVQSIAQALMGEYARRRGGKSWKS